MNYSSQQLCRLQLVGNDVVHCDSANAPYCCDLMIEVLQVCKSSRPSLMLMLVLALQKAQPMLPEPASHVHVALSAGDCMF